jgi:hypothetical protein
VYPGRYFCARLRYIPLSLKMVVGNSSEKFVNTVFTRLYGITSRKSVAYTANVKFKCCLFGFSGVLCCGMWRRVVWQKLRSVRTQSLGAKIRSRSQQAANSSSGPFLLPWRWRQQDSPTRWYQSTRLHGVTSQMIMLSVVIAVRIKNPT